MAVVDDPLTFVRAINGITGYVAQIINTGVAFVAIIGYGFA